MGDAFLDDLYAAPPAEAAPKARPRAPKPAAPSAGMAPDKFAAYLEDPSNLPSISKAGFSPEQEKTLREAWPMSNMPSDAGGHEKGAKLVKTLDQLSDYGERVFAQPKPDKKVREAVEKYYSYLAGQKKKAAGGESNILETVVEKVAGPDVDPIEALKGPARQQAADLRDLTDRLAAAKAIGGGNADELHILTAMLPAPGDTPEAAKNKKRAFANEVEGLAQSVPPQFWRAAAKHISKARRLRGPADAPQAKPGAKAAPGSPEEAAGPSEGGGMHWALRSAVKGATGLALPVIAALRAAMDETPEEHASGVAMMAPPGMAAAVGAPRTPDFIPRGKGFGEHADALRETRARNMGFPTSKAEEAEEADHPAGGRFAARLAGGMLDPMNPIFGLSSKALQAASPMVRAALEHALPGGVAGGISVAGEGGSPMDVLKGVAAGATVGQVVGKGASKFLGSPAENPLIKGIAKDEARAAGGSLADVASREAELRGDVFANPDALKAAVGDKHAAAELPFKLNEWRDKLLAKHNIQPGSKLGTSLTALEEAIDSGDTKHVMALTKLWDDAWAKSPNFSHGSASLKKDIDGLLNIRALSVAAEGAGHGHGAISNTGANAHPFQTLANAEASGGAKATALLHAAGEGYGGRALQALGSGYVRKGMDAVKNPVDAALARLYMAKQAGNMNAVQQAAEYALSVGAPFSVVTNIASSVGRPDHD